jgi:Methyltransferase domain
MIEKIHDQVGCVNIIDVGGTNQYWNILPPETLRELRMHITVVNLPSEALAPEQEHFRFVHGDGCNLSQFDDRSFHMVHSNSVVEHVGNWENAMRFANEVRRLAPAYYVQTPNFWFPIEPHFIFPAYHWLPRSTRVSLLTHFDMGHYKRSESIAQAMAYDEGCRLLDRSMVQDLFPDGKIKSERFLGLAKSLIVTREV